MARLPTTSGLHAGSGNHDVDVDNGADDDVDVDDDDEVNESENRESDRRELQECRTVCGRLQLYKC